MDMQFKDEDLAFQQEVRTFVKEQLPDHVGEKVRRGLKLAKEDVVDWQKRLNERGWFAPHWPQELGGTNWSPTQQYLFQQEMVDGNCPGVSPFGVRMRPGVRSGSNLTPFAWALTCGRSTRSSSICRAGR